MDKVSLTTLRQSQFAVFASYQDATLAFNTLNKDFIRVDLPLDNLENGIKNDSLDEDVRAELVSRSFLVDEGADEYSSFLLQYRESRYGAQPLVLYISPSLKCNATCEYCFQTELRSSDQGKEARSKESPPSQRELLTFIAPRLRDATGLKVTWFGGEPLLKSDYMERTSELLAELCGTMEKEYFASIVTNGLLLDTQMTELLRRCHVFHLQISLDGTESLHNAIGRRDGRRGYKEIIENVAALSSDFKVALRINVSSKNAHVIVELLNDLAEHGLARENITIDLPLVFDYDIGNATRQYSSNDVIPNELWGGVQLRLLAYAKQLGFYVDPDDILIAGAPLCHAIKSKGYSIWPNGAITRCIHEIETPEHLRIADSPQTIDEADSMQKWTLSEVFASGPCRSCFYLPVCGGSCVHERFLGIDPPLACPPSKKTLPDRMRWYEAVAEDVPIPIDCSPDQLIQDLKSVVSATKRQDLLPIVTLDPV